MKYGVPFILTKQLIDDAHFDVTTFTFQEALKTLLKEVENKKWDQIKVIVSCETDENV